MHVSKLHIKKFIDLIHTYISDVYEQNIFPPLNRSWLGIGTKKKPDWQNKSKVQQVYEKRMAGNDEF